MRRLYPPPISGMDFLCALRPGCSMPADRAWKHSPMMSRSNLYGRSVFHHIGIKRVPHGCDLALGEPINVD
jgi:hypothetical protein